MTKFGLLRRNSAVEIENANNRDGMGRKSARGGISSVASNFFKAFLQLFVTAILSRLLSVNDYGLMAMSGTIIAFLALFSDMGLGSASMRERQVEQSLLSTLFWLSCAVGLTLFLICCAIAPFAGAFYRDNRIIPVVMVSALGIPLASACSQHQSMMMRQARWTEINILSIVTQCLGGIIAILAAWLFSAGYWALAIQGVSAAALNTLGFWLLCRWAPSWPRHWREARTAFSFGVYLMLFNVVNYAHRQMDNVIVGRTLGAASLGYYSRGYNLFMLPLTMVVWPIAGVITPLMARHQDDPKRFATTYCSGLTSVYLVTAPLAGGLFLFADEMVTIIYGAKWLPSAEVLRILAIAIIWQPVYTSGGWIEISLGRSKRHFHAIMVAAGVYLVSFLIGVQHGIVGMAKAYLIANLLVIGPWIWFCTRRTSITLGAIVKAVRSTSFSLVLAVAATLALGPYLPLSGMMNFLLRAVLYGTCYLLASAVCWHLDRNWAELIKMTISRLRPGSTNAAS